MTHLYRFPGLEQRSPEFRRELVAMSRRLETDTNYIAAVMQTESGFDPDASNRWCRAQGRELDDCAFGLIQFMPFLLRHYGTTASEVDKLSDVEQLALVERFYSVHRGKLTSPGACYMATFLPAFIDKPSWFVLGRRDDPSGLGYGLTLGAVYQQNYGFDRNGDGIITVGDVTETAENNYRNARARGVFDEELAEDETAPTDPAPPPTTPSPPPLIPLASDYDSRSQARDEYIRRQDEADE